MKKKLAIMLASVAAIATIFTGCGKGKDISGHYVATIAAKDVMAQADLDEVNKSGLNISDISFDTTLDFTEDNKFTLAFDSTSFKDGFNKMLNDNIDTILDNAFTSQGMSRADVTDEMAQQIGYADANALFEDSKKQIQDGLNQVAEGLDKEFDAQKCGGSYTVKGDSVIFVLTDGQDGLGFDKATIKDDDTIELNCEIEEGKSTVLTFKKQK